MPQNLSERPDFFARHQALLEQAVAATASRGHRTPHPESPSKSVYGEDAAKAGEAAFGVQLGPLRLTDLAGLDIRLAIADHLHATLGERFAPPPRLLRDKVARGEPGRKTGQGFRAWP
ncbi:3-hydroxyacyl-CoA dehydrogenase family protein [Streptomyces sp. NBC_01136]|uniref:3-hydroxyacyl-CoA dehydrogenase family protein n=1 Tax=unclassified Streptomyces TaxID=2593676 RepID=UPI003250E3A4|nr:3-hydroxyacyl-CoA dehydrogenase family protein [Streptomyces sp. NBC_01136]